MDDDDVFGDLYTDALKPLKSKSSPPPPHPHRPNDRNLGCQDHDSFSEDDSATISRVLENQAPKLPDTPSCDATSQGIGTAGGDKAEGDTDSKPVIPGLSVAQPEAESLPGSATDQVIVQGSTGTGGGSDWDSDSEDDLQIVLNEGSRNGMVGADRTAKVGDNEKQDDDDDEDDHVPSSRKQIDDGGFRVQSNKDFGSGHKEKDDSLRSNYEVSDEDYLRRGRTQKNESLHGQRESNSRLKRERDEWQREQKEWDNLKQTHEEDLSMQGRERQAPLKSQRGSEDWVSRTKDEYKASDKECTTRHSKQQKRRETANEESSLYHRGHEDVSARSNQVFDNEKESRQERDNTRSGKAVDASDSQRLPEKRHKESRRKNKGHGNGDPTTLGLLRSRLDEQNGDFNEMALKGTSTNESGIGRNEISLQPDSARRHEEDASSDDKQHDSMRGRSKLEHWTSHQERDYTIPTKSSVSSRVQGVDKHINGGSIETGKPAHDSMGKQGEVTEVKNADNLVEIKDEDQKQSGERHLDTVEKLEKRSGSFKLPIPNDEDSLKVKKTVGVQFQTGLATDSPVHSSSSDDFAALIEAELESDSSGSLPTEEAKDDSDVDTDRLKRRKVEQLETLDEIQGSASVAFLEEKIEASTSKETCEHPGTFGNMCFVCGQILEESGVAFGYIHKGIRLNHDEIARLCDSDMRFLLRHRKLYLVLDLDHTLLNSTTLLHVTPEEEYLKNQTDSLEDVSRGSLFLLEFMHMMTKLRPFVHPFLKEASEMFEMYIYTMGDRPYARQMAKLLDPKGEYFGDRIISRDDGTAKHQKSLDVVLGQESAVLILDDSENAWPKHKDNLILMERYHFFASSCQQFGHNVKSLSQLKSDESEPDGALATVLKVLRQIHGLFFDEVGEDLFGRDVRKVLKEVRKEILKGCKIVFSRVFPAKYLAENHHLWRMAEQLGATCSTDVDPSVTHVVSMDVGTEKSRWAVKERKHLVHPGWIEAANYLWQKQPEENFPVEQSKKH